ncbi:MAG: DMT family transporter [Lentisphaeria bacterium]|nr:DMT family transporter [Lentisphaeria bacterium]NQZ71266.1 DMT family transporter [Lentisphaeria bacterium]
MIYIIIYAILVVLFMQSWRFSEDRTDELLIVAAGNYIMAALLSWILYYCNAYPINMYELCMGISSGIIFFCSLLFIFRCYRTVGVGITTSVMSCAFVIAILAGWLFFEYHMSTFEWIAIALIIPAMVLLRPKEKGNTKARGMADLIILFLVIGVVLLLHERIEVYGEKTTYRLAYIAIIFTVAAIMNIVYCFYHKKKWAKKDLSYGLPIGVVNVFAMLFLVYGLQKINPALFFSMTTALSVVANLIIAKLVWKEEISKRQWLGVSLALMIAVLGAFKQTNKTAETSMDKAETTTVLIVHFMF